MRVALHVEDRQEPVSKKLYNKCRNYLLAEIAIYNRHRPAPIVYMTVEKFLSARSHFDKDRNTIRTMTISKTKTYSTHGGAIVALNEDLYQLVTLFIGEIR